MRLLDLIVRKMTPELGIHAWRRETWRRDAPLEAQAFSMEWEGETMAHPNEELLRNGYDDFIKGGVGAVIDLFADDCVWHVGGRNPLAGDYKGKYGVSEFFQKLMEITEGSFELEYDDVMVSDQGGTVLCRERARRAGRNYETNTVQVWRIRDGKVTEWRRYPDDTYADDEFYS